MGTLSSRLWEMSSAMMWIWSLRISCPKTNNAYSHVHILYYIILYYVMLCFIILYYIIMSKNGIIGSHLFTYHTYIYTYIYIYIYISYLYIIFIQLYLSIHDFWPPHCLMSGCAVRWIQWVPVRSWKHQIHIGNHWWTHGSVYSL